MILVIGVVACSVAFGGIAAAGGSVATKLTIRGPNGDFHGRLISTSASCLGDRRVSVFEQLGNEPSPSTDDRIASDTSELHQMFDSVKEMLDGEGTVTVAERHGVTHQSLHNWLGRFRERGMAGLIDRSKRPRTCPHRTPARAEIRVIELRHHPRWGPRRLA